jgi:hypothetical protein
MKSHECQELHKARRRWPDMQARRDELKDSFYLYIMRSSIGAGLRTEYVPNGHMTDRLAELLKELDGIKDQAAEEQQNDRPMRKRVRGR